MLYNVISPISTNFPNVSTFLWEIEYYILGNKDYSRESFWETLVGSIDEAVKTLKIWQFLKPWYGEFLTVEATILYLFLTTFLFTVIDIPLLAENIEWT